MPFDVGGTHIFLQGHIINQPIIASQSAIALGDDGCRGRAHVHTSGNRLDDQSRIAAAQFDHGDGAVCPEIGGPDLVGILPEYEGESGEGGFLPVRPCGRIEHQVQAAAVISDIVVPRGIAADLHHLGRIGPAFGQRHIVAVRRTDEDAGLLVEIFISGRFAGDYLRPCGECHNEGGKDKYRDHDKILHLHSVPSRATARAL